MDWFVVLHGELHIVSHLSTCTTAAQSKRWPAALKRLDLWQDFYVLRNQQWCLRNRDWGKCFFFCFFLLKHGDQWDCGQCWAFSQGLSGLFFPLLSPPETLGAHIASKTWLFHLVFECVFFPKQLTSHGPLHHIREVCNVTIIHSTPSATLPSPYGWSPCLWVMALLSVCVRPHQPVRQPTMAVNRCQSWVWQQTNMADFKVQQCVQLYHLTLWPW